MKIKGFCIDDIISGNDNYNWYDENQIKKIKEKLMPHVIYFKKNDDIGLCFIEQKDNIINVLKEEFKYINLDEQFIDFDKFIDSDYYDWDHIHVGDIKIEGNLLWKEFGELLKDNENRIIKDNNKNFEHWWYFLQRIAIKNMLNEKTQQMENDLNKIIEKANNELKNYKGFQERY